MKWLLLVPALALAAVVAGCGGGEPPDGEPSTSAASAASTSAAPSSGGTTAAPSPSATSGASTVVPRFLTPDDDGRSYSMTEGQTATLLVRDPRAPDPVVEGTSVLVIAVVNVDASGRREWEVRAVGPGTSTISGGGSQPYEITLVVSDS